MEKQKIVIEKLIQVKNCRSCPFAVCDSEYGWIACNASKEVSKSLGDWISGFKELPKRGVHKLCPLKEGLIKVAIAKEIE